LPHDLPPHSFVTIPGFSTWVKGQVLRSAFLA